MPLDNEQDANGESVRMNASGLRVGVVGLGRTGSFHARTLVQLDTVSSVTLVDADLTRATSLAEELGVQVLASQTASYANFLERFAAAYRDGIAAFVETVRLGGSSPCTLHEARAALRIALAADRSRAQGRPVSIEEVA